MEDCTKKKHENYQQEVKEKWGNTAAFKEYEEKTAACSQENINIAEEGIEAVFAAFARCKNDGNAPDSTPALALVNRLQDYITDNFYICTNKILAYLGQMYVTDERFRTSINRHGDGTAEFVSQAIENYCNDNAAML